MPKDERIRKELCGLRERLRRENTRHGKVPQICSDEAIDRM